MFAYCINNPTNNSDASGNMATWALSGLISAATSVSCAYIGGERGIDLLDDAFWGFLSGAFNLIGEIYAVFEAAKTGIEFGQATGSLVGGIIVGAMSYGVSKFTGSNFNKFNVNKLNGVLMDETAEIFFDATFGYAANIFNAALTENLEDVCSTPTSNTASYQASISKGSSTTSRSTHHKLTKACYFSVL